jgi:thiol-disulfide isomerase/thioredoxin
MGRWFLPADWTCLVCYNTHTMKYTNVFIAGAAVLVLVAGYMLFSRSTGRMDEVSVTPPPTSTAPTPPTDSGALSGSYVDYHAGIIEATAETKLLFFHAPWCPQCRALEADIKRSTIPAGVTIIKIDYDTNQALRAQYGVTIQTTLVKVDDQGNLIEKYVAYDEPTLAAVVENLL